jgi:D-sedoheptulose 7-phosphate isomerase
MSETETETTIARVTRQVADLQATLARLEDCIPAIVHSGETLVSVLRAGGKILTAGNGGSAADALHLAEELVGRFDRTRRSLPAVSLVADPTLLTCIGNDFGFDSVFSRQVEGLGRSGDALVVFSTSGQSSNLIRAVERANGLGLTTIGVLGKDGGRLRGLAAEEIVVPSDVTARIQEVHTLILHLWLSMIETVNW